MSFIHDRRGQSVVIGTVILFGFLIIALAVYQAQVVPQENAQVEFEHSQEVEGDFVDLRNSILSAGRSGDARSTSVKLGTRYPQRTFFVNPPPATGQLSTTDERELRIENANVAGEENVVLYWNNQINEDGAITFNTRSLRYSPDYNEFRESSDLLYEHSLVAAEFDGTVLGRTGQTAVRPDRNSIALTAVDGDLTTNSVGRESFDPETLSENRRSVTLESDDDDPIVIELPTDVDNDKAEDYANVWRDRLQANDDDVTVEEGIIRINLDSEERYRLDLSKVGVGSGATEPTAENGYITKVSSSGGAVAEVRDEFNNPIEGVEVDVEVNGNDAGSVITDADGRAEFTPSGVRPSVRMEINDGENEWESVTFRSVSGSPDGDGGGNIINPGENADVVLDDVGSPGPSVGEFVFRNAGDEDRSFELGEMTLYYRPQGDTREEVTLVEAGGTTLELRGGFQELNEPFEIPAGERRTLTLEFDQNVRNDLLGLSFVDDENVQALYLAGIEGDTEEEDEEGDNGDGGETMASQVNIQDEGGSNNPSEVEFTLSADSDVVLTGIGVDETDTDATVVDNDDSAEFSGDLDYLNIEENDGIDIGDNPMALDTNATVDETEEEIFTLVEFRDADGNDVGNMNNQEVTITIEFQDGSQLTQMLET